MHLMHQGPHFDNDSEDNQDSVILKKESWTKSSQCSLDYTETIFIKKKDGNLHTGDNASITR